MLIKFFKNGQGRGAGPVGYLIARDVVAYSDNRDVLRDEAGKVVMHTRVPLPEVVRGDPARTEALIDATPHQWSYRSGVLSFTREDAPNERRQVEVMDAFERLAFAGLERDQWDILWGEAHPRGARRAPFRNTADGALQWAQPEHCSTRLPEGLRRPSRRAEQAARLGGPGGSRARPRRRQPDRTDQARRGPGRNSRLGDRADRRGKDPGPSEPARGADRGRLSDPSRRQGLRHRARPRHRRAPPTEGRHLP